MRDKKRKKKPNDYPLFSFRVKPNEKKDLKKRLSKAKAKLNEGLNDNEFVITGNQILIEAIRLGLPLVKRK